MSGTSRSIPDLRIANLYDPGHCGCYGNRGRYLGNGKQIPPEERAADDLLWNDNYIPWIEARRENISPIPFPGSSSNDRTVGTNDKDLFAIGNIVGSTGPAEVPARFFTGNVGNSGGVIYLAAD